MRCCAQLARADRHVCTSSRVRARRERAARFARPEAGGRGSAGARADRRPRATSTACRSSSTRCAVRARAQVDRHRCQVGPDRPGGRDLARALWDEPVHDAVSPGAELAGADPARTQSDLDRRDPGGGRSRAPGPSPARARSRPRSIPAVMTPYQVVRVLGAGGRLSGDYLVSDVSHVIGDAALHPELRAAPQRPLRGRRRARRLPGGLF